MLLEKIEALRKQPKSVRNQYAFGTALTVTLAIALIWVVSLPSRLAVTLTPETEESQSSEFLDDLGEIQAIVGDSLENIQAQAELISATSSSGSTIESTSTKSVIVATSSNQNDIFSDTPTPP